MGIFVYTSAFCSVEYSNVFKSPKPQRAIGLAAGVFSQFKGLLFGLFQEAPIIPLCKRGKNRQKVLVKNRNVHCESLQATVLVEDMNILKGPLVPHSLLP